MAGRRRDSGTLPGSRRFTFESRTFPKFWPDTESFESRGERSRKDSVYRDYTNFTGAGEPGRFICLAQCPRTSGGRSQRSGEWKISMPLHRCRALLCCRFELLAPPLECPVVDASLSGEKGNKLLWTVELWRIVLMHYTPILFFFVENVETPYNNRRLSKEGFHNSTNPLLFLPYPFHLLQQFLESITMKGKVSSLLLRCRQNVVKRIEVVLVIRHIGRSRLQSPSFPDNVPD